MAKILLIEDDTALAESLRDWLVLAKHKVDVVTNGSDGLEWLKVGDYSAAILDWELPGMSGIEVLEQFRNEGGTVPILMLTARSTLDDKVQGLDVGADDYLAKPFELRELTARLRALLRRDGAGSKISVYQFNDLVLDPVSAQVTCNNEPLKLRRTEYALLEVLIQTPGKIFTAEALLRKVWSTDSETGAETVRSHLTRLRQKIEAVSPVCTIVNTYGLGYKLTNAVPRE